jgi:hypothetical protein
MESRVKFAQGCDAQLPFLELQDVSKTREFVDGHASPSALPHSDTLGGHPQQLSDLHL